MKSIKKTIAFTLLIIMLVTLTSCSFISNIFHKHIWQDSLIKQPSCSECGIIKSVCSVCAKTKYSELSMVDHKFVNGICTACGRNSSITKVAMTDNSESEKVWSMEKIYEIALNYGFEDTYNSFVYYLDGTTLSSARIDSLGRIHLTVSFENTKGEIVNLPIAKNFERVSVKNTSAPIGTLLYADIVDRELLLTYKNGIRVSAGSLNGSASSHITGFAINASNELVIYYSDNLIAYAGLIS